MKIGILSDIHGNHYALEKVLEEAQREKVGRLLVLGDLVGYYYHPDKVLELLSHWDFKLIKGNHEEILARLVKNEIEPSAIRLKYGSGHQAALDKLSKKEISYLTNAPEQLLHTQDDVVFLMCHGSPRDANEYIYPDAAISTLQGCDVENVDFVLVGHSHYSFSCKNRYSTLINVGSVGQSRSQGGKASWVIVNTLNHVVEFRSTGYDTQNLENEISALDTDLPYLKNILKRNRFENI